MNFFEEYKSSYEQSPSWMPVPKTMTQEQKEEFLSKAVRWDFIYYVHEDATVLLDKMERKTESSTTP